MSEKLSFLLLVALSLPAQTFQFLPGYPVGCKVPTVPLMGFAPTDCVIPDLRPISPAPFVPPGVGGSYVDPTFGGVVRVVTPFIRPYTVGLSKSGVYLATGDEGGSHVFRVSDSQDMGTVGASTDAGFWWSSTVEEEYFTLVNGKFQKGNLLTGVKTIVLDPAAVGLSSIVTGGTTDLTPDHWVGFVARDAAAVPQKACIAPLDGSRKVYCLAVPSIPLFATDLQQFDFMPVTGIDVRTGRRYAVVLPWGVVLEFDGTALTVHHAPPEHPDARTWGSGDGDNVCEPRETCKTNRWDHSGIVSIAGKQYLFADYEREGPAPEISVALYDIQDRTVTPNLILPIVNRSYQSVLAGNQAHWSCARLAPMCAIGFEHAQGPLSQAKANLSKPKFAAGWIIAVDFSGAAPVFKPLAINRAIPYMSGHSPDPSYGIEGWYEAYADRPKAGPSLDGTKVAASTNFGYFPRDGYSLGAMDVRRTIVVGVGGAGVPPVPPPVPVPVPVPTPTPVPVPIPVPTPVPPAPQVCTCTCKCAIN